MHQTRNSTPKIWRIERKGTKYVVSSRYSQKLSVPVLVVMREMLKIGKIRKEIEKVLDDKKVSVNGKQVYDIKYPVCLFDIIKIGEKNYRMIIKNKKFDLEEIKGKESEQKIAKVIGKKSMKKNKIQVNFLDGRNCLSSEKLETGDSVLVNLKDNKIVKIIPAKKGSNVMFLSKSHLGQKGKIIEENEDEVKIETEKGEIVTDKKNIIVIE